jgi:hypothetical protein
MGREPEPGLQEELEQARERLGNEEFLNRMHALYSQKEKDSASSSKKQSEASVPAMMAAEAAVKANPGLTLERALDELQAHGF